MKPPIATILIPTSGERAGPLRTAVASVKQQTIEAWELFVILDGASPSTRDIALQLAREDARIRIFENPKHERRGEPYRHAALQEARGQFVTYMCDRDLYLPDFLEHSQHLLTEADFAIHPLILVGPHGNADLSIVTDVGNPDQRQLEVAKPTEKLWVNLTAIVHTTEAYCNLIEGWTSTPQPYFTDSYFAKKFLSNPNCKCRTGTTPTGILFSNHEGYPRPTEAELVERIKPWFHRIGDAEEVRRMREAYQRQLIAERFWLRQQLAHPLLIKSHPVNVEFFRQIWRRIFRH